MERVGDASVQQQRGKTIARTIWLGGDRTWTTKSSDNAAAQMGRSGDASVGQKRDTPFAHTI